MEERSRRVGLAVVVLVALAVPASASSAATSERRPDVRSALPSALVVVRLPAGACAQRRMAAVVTVTDRQRRPLARTRVVVRAGTWINPASGVTGATGKVTLQIVPLPFRRGPITLSVTATPPGRAAVTKLVPLPAC